MPAPPIPDRVALEAYQAIVESDGNITAAAMALGVPRNTLYHRYQIAMTRHDLPPAQRGGDAFTVHEPAGTERPIEDLIAARKAAYGSKAADKAARELIHVTVRVEGAYGILHMGDPHVDDDGCDWPLLESHLELIDRTEGLFGANIGDVTNNWIGRLSRLYANQSTTAAEAWRLAEWLIGRVRWLYLVRGNHDCWSGAGDPLIWMARGAGVLQQAHGVRLALQGPSGPQIRVNARHDFTGSSQWNNAHGPAKAARLGYERDHIYTAGHRHCAGQNTLIFNDGAHISHAIRVGAYKRIDEYADARNFPRENLPACLTIVNPAARQATGLVTVFWDVEAGADYLRFLRRPRVRVKAAAS